MLAHIHIRADGLVLRGASLHVPANMGGDFQLVCVHGEHLEVTYEGILWFWTALQLLRVCVHFAILEDFFKSVPSAMYWTSSFLIGHRKDCDVSDVRVL